MKLLLLMIRLFKTLQERKIIASVEYFRINNVTVIKKYICIYYPAIPSVKQII